MKWEELLRALAQPQGIAGNELARRLGVSRAAVWKRIQALRAAGLAVEASPGRGYRLAAMPDLLDAAAIRAALPEAALSLLAGLCIDAEVDSTNDAVLRDAAAGAASGWVRLAERQTAGRGRRGRHWVSPLAANVYLSVLWRFPAGLSALGGLSIVVGVAAATALQQLGVFPVRLKWPNDLVVEGRKLGGILIDAAGEWAGPSQVAIGIGVNVRMPALAGATIEQPWADLAEQLGEDVPRRSGIVAALLGTVLPALRRFEAEGLTPFLASFARLDALAGQTVLVHDGGRPWSAQVLGLVADGRLRVIDEGGQEQSLAAAEVSIRRIEP